MFQFSDYGLSVDVVLLGAIAAILILLILCLILIGKNSSLRKRQMCIRDSVKTGESGPSRYGFSVSKKVGNSVVRHHITIARAKAAKVSMIRFTHGICVTVSGSCLLYTSRYGRRYPAWRKYGGSLRAARHSLPNEQSSSYSVKDVYKRQVLHPPAGRNIFAAGERTDHSCRIP